MNTRDPKNLDDVRRVLQNNKDELMRRYDAAGVGIGKRDPKDDAYVITVLMKTSQNIPTEPVEVEGVPLKFDVTGEFKAHL